MHRPPPPEPAPEPRPLRPKLDPPRGILHERLAPGALGGPDYARYWPADDLAPFVEHFWTVAWDLAEPEIREVLPHPSVHLVLERGRSRLAGVPRGRFTRRLEGRGRVLGTKFRPGGFRPFSDRPVSALTGRELPLDELFGPAARELDAALDEADPEAAFARIQQILRTLLRWPEATREPSLAAVAQIDQIAQVDQIGQIAQITARIATDRAIARVDQVAALAGVGVRTLERRFREWVGVSPKWVIQRYRLHEAAERIAAAAGGLSIPPIPWADLALELGYADQAHFIRDFRRLVGRTPADYARRYGGANTAG